MFAFWASRQQSASAAVAANDSPQWAPPREIQIEQPVMAGQDRVGALRLRAVLEQIKRLRVFRRSSLGSATRWMLILSQIK